ncbi:MAG: glycerol kinase GlpK [Bacteroidetes bacterium]|nr:glycerol kinase GlpK [Bacteroidota bacterium]
MSYILALDQGTTSSRAIIFDREGCIVGTAQQEYPQIYPQPGWVEHNPDDIWQSQQSVANEVLHSCGLVSQDIEAIGITNQRETTVIWDRETGRPLHHAIVWQDRRTAAHCDQLRADGLSDIFQQRTGLLLDPYFSGTKIKWLLDHIPNAGDLAKAGRLCAGTVDSWLMWNLTNGRHHCTDVSNASRTLLYNLHTQEWDQELCEILSIPVDILPTIVPSCGIIGETDFLGHSIPISGIAGDQQAALFGQVCTQPGMVKNTYGTGCFLLMNTGSDAMPSTHQLLTTVAWQVESSIEFALEGSVFIGGAVVQWLRDELGLIRQSSDVELLASKVNDSGGVMMVPAFTGLGAPYWDPYARGTISGLTRGSNASHIARAALESIAYQSADVIKAMEADANIQLTEVRVDGGATANNLLMQFQADILDVPVVRPVVRETTALGAAYLSGIAIGYWPDIEVLSSLWQVDQTFEPQMPRSTAEHLMEAWSEAVERSKHSQSKSSQT